MIKHSAKVAVVTRTKNRLALLERTLRSLEEQTYQDYVHVIVNDGGDPVALNELLRRFNTEKQVVISNSSPRGMIKALNQGVKAVDSEYVAIFDDDDSWADVRLEKTIEHLDSTGAKAVVVSMDIIFEEVEGNIVRFVSQQPHPDSYDGEISLYKQCIRNYMSNGIVTYRRGVYDELGGYDEALETAEDWDFGIRLLLKYDVDFLKSDAPLFFYHQRPKATGANGNSVHTGVNQQERTINIIRNKYLRDDINKGAYGVGAIMNQAAYDLANVVRLEAHINHISRELEQHINDTTERLVKQQFHNLVKRKLKSLF